MGCIVEEVFYLREKLQNQLPFGNSRDSSTKPDYKLLVSISGA
ncbi:hypothetical protein [Ohtaekwangia kribbensis]